MSEKHDGRRVLMITLPSEGNATVRANSDQRLFFRSEFHGDHQEEWVCVENAAGIEVARWNVRYVESIHWEQP